MPVTPAVTSTTAATPAVVPIIALPLIATIAVDGGTSPCSKTVAVGTLSTTLAPYFNDHGARLDIGSMALNGLYVVMAGLTLSWTSGLTVNIAAGQAFIEGIVEIVAKTKTVADNATSRLWMDNTGAILSGTGAYAPSTAVYLGSVTTVAGSVTAIDIAGVFTMNGGLPYRITADAGKPSDTPTTTAVFLTRCVGSGAVQGGTWLWNGARYEKLENRGRVSVVYAATITLDLSKGDTFEVAALTGNPNFAAPSNAEEGKRITVYLKQDGTGSRIPTWDTTFKFPTNITFTLSTGANKLDAAFFELDTYAGGYVLTQFLKDIH